MMRLYNLILLSLIGALFISNSGICDYFFDSAIETAEWWNLRFKLYSTLFVLLGIAVFINAKGNSKIITIPILAIFIGDWKDRVLFDEPHRHWSDIFLIIISLLLVVLLWQKNDESRE